MIWTWMSIMECYLDVAVNASALSGFIHSVPGVACALPLVIVATLKQADWQTCRCCRSSHHVATNEMAVHLEVQVTTSYEFQTVTSEFVSRLSHDRFATQFCIYLNPLYSLRQSRCQATNPMNNSSFIRVRHPLSGPGWVF